MTNYKEKLLPIRAFVFDFDGVMTDGNVLTFANGETIRAANCKDGYALQYAVKQGYIVALISGATSRSIDNRMASLGVTDIYTGCANKLNTLRMFMEKYNLRPEEVVCMGDDIPDYDMMRYAGVSACPADAANEIKEMADYISLFPGGKGCVRDIMEQVMRLHGKWFQQNALEW